MQSTTLEVRGRWHSCYNLTEIQMGQKETPAGGQTLHRFCGCQEFLVRCNWACPLKAGPCLGLLQQLVNIPFLPMSGYSSLPNYPLIAVPQHLSWVSLSQTVMDRWLPWGWTDRGHSSTRPQRAFSLTPCKAWNAIWKLESVTPKSSGFLMTASNITAWEDPTDQTQWTDASPEAAFTYEQHWLMELDDGNVLNLHTVQHGSHFSPVAVDCG